MIIQSKIFAIDPKRFNEHEKYFDKVFKGSEGAPADQLSVGSRQRERIICTLNIFDNNIICGIIKSIICNNAESYKYASFFAMEVIIKSSHFKDNWFITNFFIINI